jgi:hypothetical protein
MIEKYIKMMEELKALGEQILEADETTGFEPWYDEVDCMDDHLSISLGLLKDATAE